MSISDSIFSFSKNNTHVHITSNWIDLTTDLTNIQLLDEEVEQYVALRSEKRKKEFLLVRYLRNNIYPGKQICYLPNGAPFFKDNSYSISISHTSNYIALAVSEKERVGVDLEQIKEKIISIGKKFMHPDEISTVNNHKIASEYTSYWCAKEALYKWSDIKGLSFQNDLTVLKENNTHWFGISHRVSSELIPLEIIEFDQHKLCFTY